MESSPPQGPSRGTAGQVSIRAFSHRIRRGCAPSGAAAFIARGGVGATAPALVCRFRIQPNLDFPDFSEFFQKCLTQQPKISKKVRCSCWALQKNLRSVAEDSGKTSDQLL